MAITSGAAYRKILAVGFNRLIKAPLVCQGHAQIVQGHPKSALVVQFPKDSGGSLKGCYCLAGALGRLGRQSQVVECSRILLPVIETARRLQPNSGGMQPLIHIMPPGKVISDTYREAVSDLVFSEIHG